MADENLLTSIRKAAPTDENGAEMYVAVKAVLMDKYVQEHIGWRVPQATS